ncbi:Pyridoxamine 5'-phosphate oxidase-related [Burkholderia cenocepacia PC184]|nr:Pyridoxamine 5'-phosphate oxidase-related [Burkholderia cenocepacia PC184]
MVLPRIRRQRAALAVHDAAGGHARPRWCTEGSDGRVAPGESRRARAVVSYRCTFGEGRGVASGSASLDRRQRSRRARADSCGRRCVDLRRRSATARDLGSEPPAYAAAVSCAAAARHAGRIAGSRASRQHRTRRRRLRKLLPDLHDGHAHRLARTRARRPSSRGIRAERTRLRSSLDRALTLAERTQSAQGRPSDAAWIIHARITAIASSSRRSAGYTR